MKKLGLATTLLLAMTGAQAYQVEVQGQSQFVDTNDAHKRYTGALEGTYYFENVDSSKGPLAEAAFLNQASNVAVAYNFGKYSSTDTTTKYDSQTYGIKGEAYIPTSLVPVYTSASYSHTYRDNKNGTGHDNGDKYSVEVGAMLTPNFLVAGGYTRIADQAGSTYDAFDLANGVIKAGFDRAVIGDKKDVGTARAKYVGPIDGTNMSFGFETGLISGEETAYSVKSDLYLTPALSFGGSFAATNANLPVDRIWSANVNYFVTQDLSVAVNYESTSAIGKNPSNQAFGLNAKYRF